MGPKSYRWRQRNQSRLEAVIDLLEKIYGEPRRRPELEILQVLVLTILSQNTTDVNSRRAYLQLLRQHPPGNGLPEPVKSETADLKVVDSAKELPAPDWTAVYQAGHEELAKTIAPAGLQQSKSATIMNVLEVCLDSSSAGEVRPFGEIKGQGWKQKLDWLTGIKGIGVKTAAVVLMEAGQADICPVDTHVNRICRRLKFVRYEGPSRDIVFRRLQPLVPGGKAYSLHHNLITFGRDTCTAQNPECESCRVSRLCWDLRVRRRGEKLDVKFK